MQPSTRQSLESAIVRSFAVPAADAPSVLDALQPCTCRGGDWLFRQGDEADSLYLLARGRLQVWIESQDHNVRREHFVAEVGPGETVGEISLLTGDRRSASIRAVRDSLLLRMDAAAFDRLARERPELVRRLAGGIASRLRARTAGSARHRRAFRTIALLPLDPEPSCEPLVRQLAAGLARRGTVQVLSAGRLQSLGAPALPAAHHQQVSAAFTDWLAEQEEAHRFLLLVGEPADSVWSRLTLRHADLILLVGDGAADPALRPIEQALLGSPAGPVARRALVLRHAGQPAALSGTSAWLSGRAIDYHFHLRDGVPADLDRLLRLLSGESVGLVLGGGAARGFAHLGVYQALLEAGIAVDWVGGASIGAVMAAPVAMGLAHEEIIALAREAFVRGKPFGDVTLPILSLLRGRRMERLIGMHLSGDIEDLPVPFYCISSNLGQGTPHVHERGGLAQAVRASLSLPGIFPPAIVNGQLAIDGGILDNLPVDVMLERPVGRVIAVDLTSRQDFTVDYDEVPSPWAVLAGRVLPFMPRHRVPRLMSLMLKATEIGTMTAVRAAGERADLLLRPPVSRFSLTDVRSFDEIVRVGYDYTRQALAAGPGG